jgi:hypothetical protein
LPSAIGRLSRITTEETGKVTACVRGITSCYPKASIAFRSEEKPLASILLLTDIEWRS